MDRIKKRRSLLFSNLRFYVLFVSFLLSIGLLSWLRMTIVGDQAFSIRLQQAFAFLAILYWYLALIISPLSSFFGKDGIMRQLLFARRAIGVSAGGFALLHSSVALWGQLGGFSGLGFTSNSFKQALLYGLVGLIVLIAMAATSFDVVIRFMTFKRWKWLHRLGYIALIFVLVHVWVLGTHSVYGWVQLTVFSMLSLLIGLESASDHKVFGGS